MSFAARTDVPIERSQAQLRVLLEKHGCARFMQYDEAKHAVIMFEVRNRVVRFNLPLPLRAEFQRQEKWNQAMRSRWRSLLLCVKAKLESVETGILSFEEEFLANFVLPNGRLFGDEAVPALMAGKTPNLGAILALPEK